MTIIHCRASDGSCVSFMSDEQYAKHGLSELMRKMFFHVKSDLPIEKLKELTRPVYDDKNPEEILQKYKGKIDLEKVLPVEFHAKVKDKKQVVEPFDIKVALKDITEFQKQVSHG